MYGTLARVRPKQGQGQVIIGLTERWISERAADVPGFVADYLLIPDSGQGDMLILSVFASEEAYRANADATEQDRWYREFRAALESDPEWSDGEIIAFEGARVPL
jgi:heme-degrading monooxygenase HmoA